MSHPQMPLLDQPHLEKWALEAVAGITDLLGAESAGEQKAAASTRRERTVTQSFMVLAEKRLSWS